VTCQRNHFPQHKTYCRQQQQQKQEQKQKQKLKQKQKQQSKQKQYKCQNNYNDKGRAMIANQFLPSHTRILESSSNQPYFQSIVPPVLNASERSRRCSYCFTLLNENQFNQSTKTTKSFHLFCSKECFREGVSNFGTEQVTITRSNVNQNSISPVSLLLYRIIQQIYNEEASGESKTRKLMHPLVSNTPSTTHNYNQDSSTYHQFVVQTTLQLIRCSKLQQVSTSLDTKEMTNWLLQILQNAFSISDDESENNGSIGLGLFTKAAIINHSCQPNLVQTFDYGNVGQSPRLILTTSSDVQMGAELCIAYNDVLQIPSRRRLELYQQYNFWCHCQRCIDTTISSTNTNRLYTLDELYDGLRCLTKGCDGYGIRTNTVLVDDEDEQEEKNENNKCNDYRCFICKRVNSFEKQEKKREQALKIIDNYWAQQKKHIDSTLFRRKLQQEIEIPTTTIEKLQCSYQSMKQCCHLSSWYVQYSGDALVSLLLDTASSSQRENAIMMGLYTGAHSILKELLSSKQQQKLLQNDYAPLNQLQNRYKAAKLELFLYPDPRKACLELQDILKTYQFYYPPNHNLIQGLLQCLQSAYQ